MLWVSKTCVTSIPDALMIRALHLIFNNIQVSTDFTGRFGNLENLDFQKLSLLLLWIKMWHHFIRVKTLLGEAVIAEPVPGPTLGAAFGAALSSGWSHSTEAELVPSGMEQH